MQAERTIMKLTDIQKVFENMEKTLAEGGDISTIPLQIQKIYDAGLIEGSSVQEAWFELAKSRFDNENSLYNKQMQSLEYERNAKYDSAAYIADVFKRENWQQSKPSQTLKTGFKELDRKLYGGLRPGLCVIGGVSAVGKTTFVLQLAENMAKAGEDVLFFSLEMSKLELIGKGISRRTFEEVGQRKNKNNHFIARNLTEVIDRNLYDSFTEEEKETMERAVKRYQVETENLYIYEGFHNGTRLNIDHIRDIVTTHKMEKGKNPIVIIDYLQIIAPKDVRMTDKQATDQNVFELKTLSRKEDMLVIAVSSFNRDSYTEPVSLASFKESGAIEYSADYLIGLQPSGMEWMAGEKEKDRIERMRELEKDNSRKQREREPVDIDIKMLKNRKGYKFINQMKTVHAYNAYIDEEPVEEGFEPAEIDLMAEFEKMK